MQVLQQLLEIKRKDMEKARKEKERAHRAAQAAATKAAHSITDTLPELTDELTFAELAVFAQQHNKVLSDVLEILFDHGLDKSMKVVNGRNAMAAATSEIKDEVLYQDLKDHGGYQYSKIIMTVMNLAKWVRMSEYEKNAPNRR